MNRLRPGRTENGPWPFQTGSVLSGSVDNHCRVHRDVLIEPFRVSICQTDAAVGRRMFADHAGHASSRPGMDSVSAVLAPPDDAFMIRGSPVYSVGAGRAGRRSLARGGIALADDMPVPPLSLENRETLTA